MSAERLAVASAERWAATSSERIATALWPYRWECAWGVFALANLLWMIMMPAWVSIPFHFIWVSFTVLFGFRIWTNAFTWSLALLVVGGTGIVLVQAWVRGMRADELFEIPLMFCMFLAMVWHTNRRKVAFVGLQRVSEQNARLLQRERSFLQNASHELRTPITVALAHAELMQLTVTRRSVNDDVEIIADELGRLRGLTDRLLLLAAVDAPEFVHPVPTDLTALVAATVRRWAPTRRRLLIGCRDEATVLADPERLILALDTVLENAIKVTGDGDPIELSVARHEDSAVVEISDSGPGIPPELLDSIFERFARGEAQRGSRAGFGLGLAIVNAIAEAHGGSVTARNRPDGGAVVALRLPLAEEHAGPPAGGPRSAPEAVERVLADPAPDRLASPA